MPDEMTPFRPAPMEGHGAYNSHSTVQASGASPALRLLERVASETALPAGEEAIVIADYGSSEGRNSLAPMATAIRALRARAGLTRAISVVHTDLPGNDFSALFQLLATDPASYLRDNPAVFASAVGHSFYEQILPSKSATLGWSGGPCNGSAAFLRRSRITSRSPAAETPRLARPTPGRHRRIGRASSHAGAVNCDGAASWWF